MSADTSFIGLILAAFIEFTWWEIYLIAWAVAAPAVLVSLVLLWGAPRWWEFDRPGWLWSAITVVLFVAAPLGVLWVTLAVGPDGFLGQTHAYGTLELMAYHWLPGLLTLPPVTLAGLLAWRRWAGMEGRDGSGSGADHGAR